MPPKPILAFAPIAAEVGADSTTVVDVTDDTLVPCGTLVPQTAMPAATPDVPANVNVPPALDCAALVVRYDGSAPVPWVPTVPTKLIWDVADPLPKTISSPNEGLAANFIHATARLLVGFHVVPGLFQAVPWVCVSGLSV